MRNRIAVTGLAALTLSCAHSLHEVKAPASTPSAIARQITNAIDAGDGDYEIRALREEIAKNPDSVDARLTLAAAYRQRGYPELALEHYRLAAGHFPDSADLQLRLAKALREFGMTAEAADGLDVFLRHHPVTAVMAAWLGILRDDLGQWEKGETAYRAALSCDGNLDYVHNNLGYNLLKQGKQEEAIAELRLALKLNPQSTVARNNLGMALANTPEQAVLHWQSMSDPASAHSNMAAVLIEAGKYAEARRELDIALGYNKTHSAALNNLRLVSQLDGKPAFLPAQPVQTRWARWKSHVRKTVSNDGPVQSASR